MAHSSHTHTGLWRSSLELQNEDETPSHKLAVATATQSAPPKTADKLAHSTLEGKLDMATTTWEKLASGNNLVSGLWSKLGSRSENFYV